MSDKDRAKKDHQRTDKKNKAMRDKANRRTHQATPRQQSSESSPDDRERRPNRT